MPRVCDDFITITIAVDTTVMRLSSCALVCAYLPVRFCDSCAYSLNTLLPQSFLVLETCGPSKKKGRTWEH